MLVATALIMFIMAILSEAFVASTKTFRDLKAVGDMAEKLRTATTLLKRYLSADHFEGKKRLSDPSFWASGPPQEGFFRVFQATPAIALVTPPAANTNSLEGTDPDAGQVSTITTNAALHFTVKLRGNTRGDFFSAAVPAGSPLLAPLLGSPESRFQDATNTYNSQWAEVAFFPVLLPDTANGVPLYALYMRQRLIVADTSTGGFITTASAGVPITITSANHNLATGQQVIISGVAGNTAANNTPANPTWTITYFDANNFTLNGTTGTVAGTGGTWTLFPATGTPAAISGASNPVAPNPIPITTASAHGLTIGQPYQVVISGVGGNTAANGIWTITVTTPTQFQLNGSLANAAYTSGGTWTLFSGLPITAFGAVPSAYAEMSGIVRGYTSQNFICNTPRDVTEPARRFDSATGTVAGASNPAAPTPITITTPTTAGLASGQQVLVSGVLGNTAANGTWTITNITPTTFDLVGSTGNGTAAPGTGTWLAMYTTLATDIPTTAANYTQLVGSDLILSDMVSFDVRLLPAGGTDFVDVFALASTFGASGASSNPFFSATTGPMVFDTWSSVTDDFYDYSGWATGGTATSMPICNNGVGPTIKAIQVILRVWDAKTEQTRQVTLVVPL
jgi:hypothetical protein